MTHAEQLLARDEDGPLGWWELTALVDFASSLGPSGDAQIGLTLLDAIEEAVARRRLRGGSSTGTSLIVARSELVAQLGGYLPPWAESSGMTVEAARLLIADLESELQTRMPDRDEWHRTAARVIELATDAGREVVPPGRITNLRARIIHHVARLILSQGSIEFVMCLGPDNIYVQFAPELRDLELRAECTGDEYLDPGRRSDEATQRALRALGWRDPDDGGNWWQVLVNPDLGAVADLVQQTFRTYGVMLKDVDVVLPWTGQAA
ncbi:MAG TPA: hypothetical protein VIM30_00120 [Candidatus Limnocylindrales bacterium]